MSEQWQESTEGMVAADVRAVILGTQRLVVNSFNAEGYAAITNEREDLELAHRELGRMLDRLPVQHLAAAE
jgi:hypothetical protein